MHTPTIIDTICENMINFKLIPEPKQLEYEQNMFNNFMNMASEYRSGKRPRLTNIPNSLKKKEAIEQPKIGEVHEYKPIVALNEAACEQLVETMANLNPILGEIKEQLIESINQLEANGIIAMETSMINEFVVHDTIETLDKMGKLGKKQVLLVTDNPWRPIYDKCTVDFMFPDIASDAVDFEQWRGDAPNDIKTYYLDDVLDRELLQFGRYDLVIISLKDLRNSLLIQLLDAIKTEDVPVIYISSEVNGDVQSLTFAYNTDRSVNDFNRTDNIIDIAYRGNDLPYAYPYVDQFSEKFKDFDDLHDRSFGEMLVRDMTPISTMSFVSMLWLKNNKRRIVDNLRNGVVFVSKNRTSVRLFSEILWDEPDVSFELKVKIGFITKYGVFNVNAKLVYQITKSVLDMNTAIPCWYAEDRFGNYVGLVDIQIKMMGKFRECLMTYLGVDKNSCFSIMYMSSYINPLIFMDQERIRSDLRVSAVYRNFQEWATTCTVPNIGNDDLEVLSRLVKAHEAILDINGGSIGADYILRRVKRDVTKIMQVAGTRFSYHITPWIAFYFITFLTIIRGDDYRHASNHSVWVDEIYMMIESLSAQDFRVFWGVTTG